MRTYITVQGDTYDRIALLVYGNERRMDVLIKANPGHGHVAVFSANIVLAVPDLPESGEDSSNLPPWRRV